MLLMCVRNGQKEKITFAGNADGCSHEQNLASIANTQYEVQLRKYTNNILKYFTCVNGTQDTTSHICKSRALRNEPKINIC